MESLGWRFALTMFPAIGLLFLVVAILWIATGGIDKLRHPEEYRGKGAAAERNLYLVLQRKYHIPAEQIFRNVYIPTPSGTTEIDLLVVSRKGILVFECKDYHGNIYGDGDHPRWIQYCGRQKNYFLSPVVQNRTHLKHLSAFLKDFPGIPLVPLVVTTTGAKWHLKNIDLNDHVLGVTGVHFCDVYSNLSDFPGMSRYYRPLCRIFRELERPSPVVRAQHIQNLQKRQRRH